MVKVMSNRTIPCGGGSFRKSGKGRDVRPGSGDKLDASARCLCWESFMQDTIVGK